jgi:pyrophosphate--fructose-6-phosphate 1-phosphotransferase
MFLIENIICFYVRTLVKPGCPQEVLKAALSVMGSVTEVLTAMSSSAGNVTSF